MRYDDLEKINKLRDQGILSTAEFEIEKQKILNANNYSSSNSTNALGMETNTYCVFLHLSQFVGNFFGPLIMWLMGKDKDPVIDAHGKVCLNWAISSIIYALGCGILCFVLIGIPMLIALGIAHTVFIIIGAVKASEGVLWKYPLSIEFLK